MHIVILDLLQISQTAGIPGILGLSGKEKKLFSQHLRLSRDQQSGKYFHLYVQQLKIPSASEFQKYYGDMTNQKTSANREACNWHLTLRACK